MIGVGRDAHNKVDDIYVNEGMVEAIWTSYSEEPRKAGELPVKVTSVRLVTGRIYGTNAPIKEVVKKIKEALDETRRRKSVGDRTTS